MTRKNSDKRVLKGRAAGIVLEDIDSKLDLIVEKVELSETRLVAKMEEFKKEIKGEVQIIRAVVGTHSGGLSDHERRISALEETVQH